MNTFSSFHFRTRVWYSLLLVVSLCTSLSHGADLMQMQDQQVAALDQIETKMTKLLTTLEETTPNAEIREQLEETTHEISYLIDVQQDAMRESTTPEEIGTLLEETKDRIVLKTYDALTTDNALADSISVPGNHMQQATAVDVALDQIVDTDTITVQIKTMTLPERIASDLQRYETTATVTELFQQDGFFFLEVTVSATGLVREELFGSITAGMVPTHLLGYPIVMPEVYTIGQIQLSGEQLASLRGIYRWQTPRYISALSDPQLPKVHIWIIDTGIDPTHPDLAAAISTTIPGYDFVNDDADPMDDHQHGTHVAWTIAAQVNNWWVVGVNPAVKLVPLKICTKTGYCPSYAITNALKYAADKGIDVVNMSLGGAGNLVNNPTCAAISYAATKWTVAVVAAGNANTTASSFIPAACPETITVGAVDSMLTRASFSNFWPEVDISAPGVGIYSTVPNNKRWFLDGTSMATPHISAAVAAIRAQRWALSASDLITLLRAHTLTVTTESGKPIWWFLDYPALMQTLWFIPDEPICGTDPCFWPRAWTGVITTQQFITTWITIQSNTTPLQQDGLTINYSSLWIRVGETVTITIDGGKNGYTISKWSEHFGRGNRINTSVTSTTGNRVKTTLTIVGLQSGSTNLLITDVATNKTITLPITITPQTILTKVGEKITISNWAFWTISAITFTGNIGHLVKTQDGWWFFQEYTAKKSGTIQMRVTITNKSENKAQDMLYEVRSHADPLRASTALISLQVGRSTNQIDIAWWSPPYTVKKWSPHLGFWFKTSDIALASALPTPEIVFSPEDLWPDPLVVSGITTTPCDSSLCSNTPLPSGLLLAELFTPAESSWSETITMANSVFSFAPLPLTAGISSITVTDADGSTLTIPVKIEPSDLRIKLNSQLGWYYLNTDYNYEIKSVTSSHPGIIAVTYSSKTYIATAKSPGYATLTFSLYNKTEQRNQLMQINVIVGTPEPLELISTKETLSVWETVEIHIKWGMGPYKVSKTNENIGLGFGSDTSPISIAGGTAKQVAQIQIPYKNELVPRTALSWAAQLVLSSWGALVELIDPAELSGCDQIGVQGILPASTPITVEGVQIVRVVWLQPGTTTITITDADGSIKQLPVTVTPKKLMIDTLDHKTVLSSQLSHPWRREIKQISTSTPAVMGRTAYGNSLLKWFYQWSGDVFVDIYNHHEGKKQTLVYSIEVIWPTYAQYLQAIADAIARAKANAGKRSSLTTTDLINAGLDPCYSVRSCIRYRESTWWSATAEKNLLADRTSIELPISSYQMSAWQMTVINLLVEKNNEVTVEYDATNLIVKEYTGSWRIEKMANLTDTLSWDSDEWLWSEIYEVIDAPTESYLLAEWLPTTQVLYKQYIVMGKPWAHSVKFSSKFGKNIHASIYYTDKTYTIPLGKVIRNNIHTMPLIAAYSANSAVVDTWASFEATDSKWLPIWSSPNDKVFIQANSYGSTILHREFDETYNFPITNKLKVLDVKVKVPNPNIPETTTINLDKNKIYQLTFDENYEYQIIDEHELLTFNDYDEYRIAKQSWWYVTSETQIANSIKIDSSMIIKGASIFFNEIKGLSENNWNIKIISYAKWSSKVISEVVITFLDTYSTNSDQEIEWFSLQQNQIPIESFLHTLIIKHLLYVEKLWKTATYLRFYNNFWDNGPLNLKLSLQRFWYISADSLEIKLYGETFKTADLWNLILWFFRESANIYEDGSWFSDKFEYNNYKKFYWETLWFERAMIDEIADKPRYAAWKNVYHTFIKEASSFTTSSLSLLIKNEALLTKNNNRCLEEQQTKDTYTICQKSVNLPISSLERFPIWCAWLYVQRSQDISDYTRILNGKTVTIHDIYLDPDKLKKFIQTESNNQWKAKYEACFKNQ